MKLRMKFEKDNPVKFISHLDMMRTFERAFRRADLPIAFTKGYNPRPKISFTPALSVGITSSSEYMDVEFYEDVSIEEVATRLNRVLPEGLQIIKTGIADEKLPLSMLNGAVYVVKAALNTVNLKELIEGINIISHQEEIIVEKVTKSGTRSINIAPLIYRIDLLSTEPTHPKTLAPIGGEYQRAAKSSIDSTNIKMGFFPHLNEVSFDNDENTVNLLMAISIGQQGSVSPRLIVLELERVLGKKLEVLSIYREELFYTNKNNKILPL